jgi:flagellar basal-body rod protein FlgC
MSLFNAFKIAGSAMMAQSKRLSAVASNMANADTAAETSGQAYQARKVVFESTLQNIGANGAGTGGVQVKTVTTDTTPGKKVYDPKHPLADKEGYILMPNVNAVDEMVDMIASSRSYQTNAEVMNTSKSLMLKTLSMGQ